MRRFAAVASGLVSGLAPAVRPAGAAEVSGAQGRVRRVAAITGAASGVLTVAASAFSPRISKLFPWILVCPNAAPCLRCPYTRFCVEPSVDEGQHIGARQQRRAAGQFSQRLPLHVLKLADISPGKGPQARPQRRRRLDPAKQPVHRAVAQQPHVIDRIRPSHHPRRQAANLQIRVHPAPVTNPDMLGH